MIVYLGLGSNLGDRVSALQQALQMLTDHSHIKLLSASSFYETEPVGFAHQDWFVNVAIAVETDLPPEAMLAHCLTVETQMGRTRDLQNQNGPRLIDIDILFYGNLVMHQPGLTLPHPRVHERAFTLVPLLEINSRLKHPVSGKSIEQLHHELENPEEVVLYGTRLTP